MSQFDEKDETLQGIAIVGLSGRFPGAKNTAEFWQNLIGGAESIEVFSEEDLTESTVDRTHPDYIPAGAVLEDADTFDAPFFDFLPSEAEITDPQQRLFLECSWEALEDAGYDSKKYDGRIGVFGGVGRNTYVNRLYANPDLIAAVGQYPAAVGNDADFLATRVAYKLNLRGPAITVQTACSTSLVSVHLACQSLLTYECDMALAGGAAVKTPQKEGYIHQEGGIFSKDGHCRAFDENSSGTVLGNGVGLVLLKRLEDAVADGDHVYAVIKGSAINNDGAAKVGFTAPSVERQADVIADALALADIDPATISYVETHGTGTALGDPIEISALTEAYRLHTEESGYCAIGSVKTNIGHLDTAAGVTGLIKTALSLHHRQLPPTLHYQAANPKIDFANSPFYVNVELRDWKAGEHPRRAGVSSFGMGGTNAHAVLEEAPLLEKAGESRSNHLLVLSAKTATALDAITDNLATYFEQRPQADLADAAYTLQVGRREFHHRRTVVAADGAEAARLLRERPQAREAAGESTPLLFVFSGQGSQYIGMARDLYDTERTFRETVDRCADLLRPHLGRNLLDLIYPAEETADEARDLLNQTRYTQPALFVIEYALATQLLAWGMQPAAMFGHSIGEYVAATLAGVIALEDALPLVAARGRLMQEMPVGSMLAVQLSEDQASKYLTPEISIAGINGPHSVVLAGPTDAIAALEQELVKQNVLVRALQTSHAFHSAMMEPVLARFEELVGRIELQAPSMPYLSNVSGTWITVAEATDPAYYSRHLREAVRFADNVRTALTEHPQAVVLEVGPGRSLSTLIRQQIQAEGIEAAVLSTTRHPDEKQPDDAFLLTAVGQLWGFGVGIDFLRFNEGSAVRRVSLPTYPFERRRYYLKPGQLVIQSAKKGRQRDLADWFSIPAWSQTPPLFPQETATGQSFLLIHDDSEFGESLAQRFRAVGHEVITARTDADYGDIFKQGVPSHIVHLGGLLAGGEEIDAQTAQERGFYSLLSLAQALGAIQHAEITQLTLLTNNLQAVTSEPILQPARATILGAAKVIPQEYEHLTSRVLDIELPVAGSWHEARVLDQIIAEISEQRDDFLVAYRGAHRFVQTFEKAKLTESKQAAFRTGGTYLITGATDTLGLLLAEHLATEAHAKLILLARPDFPARSEWADWLAAHAAHAEDDSRTDAIRRLQALLEQGIEILFAPVDLTDRTQISQVLADARDAFGDLHGVLHADETVGNGLTQLKTRDAVEAVLQPKLYGTLALAAACADLELDVFAVFSRMLAVTGGFGQTDNAAVSAFLDAFAAERAGQGGAAQTLVLDFGMWQFDALPDGPMIPAELKAQFANLQSAYGLTFEEGMSAFARALHSRLPQVIVSAQELSEVIAELSELTPSRFLNSLQGNRPTLDANREYIAPSTEIERQVAGFWEELFGMEQISIHDNFFELGGNSLLGVQLVNRVRNAFDVDLPMSVLFEGGTVAGLSAYIAGNQLNEEEMVEIERMLAEIEALSADEAASKLGGV
ncbi:beta-ketoacyl synthase N-terminal-like domain-containing protein [Tumebacillus sp. DT12]|uniref:Beta-ketoacyl synthase N-terminal-like domain-containing protein n=1 Tax=Tumebacillus lacus TaxID=2995335 RepID=A0ABT3WVU9_9BACL|nr:type I polyketide synthase [Tumebacillus lacus]MCX7568805.1 beta-ketoacyl synthase N-terminal-like domain-containing protein [Tumebacillus lacus]